jgi:hypothetical protein
MKTYRRTQRFVDCTVAAKNIFIIDTLQYRNFYLNSQKVRYSHCTYVNTEGAQDLFMEEDFGAHTTA